MLHARLNCLSPVKNLCCKLAGLLLVIFSVCPGFSYAQSISNAGTEFWSVFPTHEPDGTLLANLSIFITSSQASSGSIQAGAFSTRFSVAANAVTEVQIPRSAAYINDYEGNQVLSGRAIHLLVDSGKPKVVIYTHIFAGRRSAASLILPKEALGQQYFSMNYTQDDAGQNFITVVASQPHTKIHIRRGTTELVPGGILLDKVNDVYEYLSPGDLTGVSVAVDSLISGCNSFALFSGSSGVRIGTPGCDPQSIDPLFQQCYPITSWGKNYGFVPFSMNSPNFSNLVRTAGQYLRVLAKDDGTIVSINGQQTITLSAGQFYTSPQPVNVASYISANKPVSVAQFALTQSCSNVNTNNPGYSDPDMVLLNPIEYNINHITLYSSTRENITEQYINILMKTASAPGFHINNAVPAAPFIPMANLPGYSYLQLSLNNLGTNTFSLDAADGFNAIAYGFGNVESYSYSAGTNLAATESISAILTASKTAVDSTCINSDYFFKLTLPYQSPQISWQMDAAETPTVQNNPVGTPVTVQGITYYEYTFPKTAAYQLAGKHIVKILTQYPATLGGCSLGQQQINYAFTVIPVPVAALSATAEKCHNVIDFTDLTPPNPVNHQVGRIWDFGDGQGSALQNPVHTYADTGRYIARLTVTFTSGCQDTKLDTVVITQKTYPGFSFSNQDCVGKAITFTDSSKTADFTIGTRQWIFGDGDTVLVNSGAPFQHVFKKAGTYHVQLTLINTQGCNSPVYVRTVVVHDIPTPDFNLPGICITDQLAKFTDLTATGSITDKPYTYLWDFGDPNATAQNPDTSSLQNPTHKYGVARDYPVTLTVTSPYGCVGTLIKTFTVNGANPVASFKLLSNQICASDVAMVQNNSTVDFGSITKLEWHFDNTNHPDSMEVYTTPKAGQLFGHRYPVFHAPASQTYTIKLLAYSGTQCVADTSKTITVYAVPQIAFDTLAKVCLSATVFKLTQGRQVSALAGSVAYSGDGVAADGAFDPVKAGAGTHLIKYKFTSAFGCADSLSQPITVVTDPTVNAGDDLRILQGDQVTLSAKTTGSNLTYKWTPATGLDRDDVANPVAAPDKDITYVVTVSNGTCQASDDVHITVIPPLFIPNTFTPNGDGVNDSWNIKNLDYYYPGALVEIYTKLGRKIFSSTGYPIPWDGRYKGFEMPADTYYYIIDLHNGKKKLASWLELIR